MSEFVVEYIIVGGPEYDVESRVSEAMVAKQTVHAVAYVVKLFVQTLVVLQTTPFFDTGIVT